jgi:phosphoserine aminotransferase
MSLISFYPGPSRINSNISKFVLEAFDQGILAMNHRSDEFMNLVGSTKKVIHEKLNLPKNYQIIFTSSATECWEIFAQSCLSGISQHVYNGAFGRKWATITDKLDFPTVHTSFGLEEIPELKEINPKSEWICLTHCETSNGTFLNNTILRQIRKQFPDQLIAIDATATMGGLNIDFQLGDFWFASVQKCFGLPSGLAVLIVSDKAITKAQAINERNHYNSLLNMLDNTAKNQTHYTPNILNIFLLFKSLNKIKSVEKINEKLDERFKYYNQLIKELPTINWLVKNPAVRSPTVLALTHPSPESLKNKAKQNGFILGNGYGPWKDNTFRVANFPSIKWKEVMKLTSFLQSTNV